MMQGWGRLPGRDQVRGQNHIDTGYGVKKVAAQKKITRNDQDLSYNHEIEIRLNLILEGRIYNPGGM